jgi:hypothetical protein
MLLVSEPSAPTVSGMDSLAHRADALDGPSLEELLTLLQAVTADRLGADVDDLAAPLVVNVRVVGVRNRP